MVIGEGPLECATPDPANVFTLKLELVPTQRMTQRGVRHSAPVHSVPNEVIIAIFRLLQQPASHRVNIGNADLLSVSTVCRRWRNVALEYPALWTEISLYNPVLATLFLERSRSTPIRVIVGDTMSLTDPATGEYPYPDGLTGLVVPQHAQRIISLVIEDQFGDNLEEWLNALKSVGPLPNLTELVLDHEYDRDAEPWTYQWAVRPKLPHLQKLALRSVHIPSKSPVYQNIRCLEFTGLDMDPSTLEHFIRVLSQSPAL